MAMPPGPAVSSFWQTVSWARRPMQFLRDCEREFGDIFTLRMLGIGTFAVISQPDAIRQLFTLPPGAVTAGEAASVLVPLVGESSVLLLDGDSHMRQRRLLLPPFHGERMKAYAAAMRDATRAEIATWSTGMPFSIHPRLQQITLRVILTTVFGVEDPARMERLGEQLTRVLAFGDSPMLAIQGLRHLARRRKRRFEAERDRADELIYELIARRKAERGRERDDVMTMLLSAVDEDGAPMTDQELRDELMTLLVAGHETTATALAWTVERLLSHRAVLDRLRAELADVVGTAPIEDHHVSRLPYLDAVVREALRLRPVIPMVVRVLQQPLTLLGHDLPIGTVVAANIYITQRRPDIYPEPDRFLPERWLDMRPNPYAWLPFGGSFRRCIGMAFALYEMKIVLATILTRTDLGLAPGTSDRMARRAITFAPSGGPQVLALSVDRPEPVQSLA